MSKVTKPVVLDETAKQVVAQMQLQNEILTSLASGINYKPTSIKDVLNVVRAGQASKVFQVGDQIIVPWTDIATGQKYDVPLDIVAFGTSALQDGEELPSMTVQWHYATPFGVQFNQYQAFFYATEGLAAGTYYIEIGTTWGDKGYCVAGKNTSLRSQSLCQQAVSLPDSEAHRIRRLLLGKYIHTTVRRRWTLLRRFR